MNRHYGFYGKDVQDHEYKFYDKCLLFLDKLFRRLLHFTQEQHFSRDTFSLIEIGLCTFVCLFWFIFLIFKAYVLASNISFSGFHVFLNIYFHISKLRWNTVIHRGTATCSKVWSFIWTCIFQSVVISGLLNGRNARLYCPWGVYADRLYKLLWLVVSRGYYVWDVDWWVSKSTLFFFSLYISVTYKKSCKS